MSELNFGHNLINPKLLPVLEKIKELYKKWIPIHKNMPKTEQLGIGSKIDFLFLELLDLTRKAVYAPIDLKIKLLEKIIEIIDSLRFFFQILWETRLISDKQFILLGKDMEEIGKMAGGWKKGLLNKTSATKAEERK
jgi:hypothetical protein